MQTLPRGTAKITTRQNGTVLLTYVLNTSGLLGERICLNETEAREFCRERRVRVLPC